MSDAPQEVLDIKKRLAQAIRVIGPVAKKGTGHHGKYTTLNDVLATVQHALDDVDLVVSQPIISRDEVCEVTTMITDIRNGESISFGGPAFPFKNDPQAAGSAITYYRRYGLVSLFGIRADDDDGGVAHRQATTPQARTAAEKKIRQLASELGEDRAVFQAEFMETFGSTLTNLPESKHGEALAWAEAWKANSE